MIQESGRFFQILHHPQKEDVFRSIQLNTYQTIDVQQSRNPFYVQKNTRQLGSRATKILK